MKKLYAALLASAFPALAFGQAANITRSDMDNTAGLLISTGLQNAVSQTYFNNDGNSFLLVKNNNGSTVTANEISQKTSLSIDRYGSISFGNQSVSIANGETRLLGPFPTGRWNTVNGTTEVSFSVVTGVSVTAVRVPK